MKQFLIIIMLVGFLAVGCSQSKKVFYPLEMQTQNQFQADKEYCNGKAKEAAFEDDIQYHDRVEVWRKVFEGCMDIKGYELEPYG